MMEASSGLFKTFAVSKFIEKLKTTPFGLVENQF